MDEEEQGRRPHPPEVRTPTGMKEVYKANNYTSTPNPARCLKLV